jgi:heat shock protein HslJ
MTDEQMDARLQAAGTAWRSATDATATQDGTAPVTLNGPGPAGVRRTHRTLLALSAAVVGAVLVAGGFLALRGDDKRAASADTATLQGTVWRLVGYGDAPARTNSLSTFYIGKDGRLVADDGCTLIDAAVRTSGARLRLGGYTPRYYGCTDPVGEVTFDRGLTTLTSTPTWSVDGDELTISHAGDPTLHLRPAPQLLPPTTDVPTMPGAKWRLVTATAGGKDLRIVGAPALEVAGGRVSAANGCNRVSGNATVADGRLTTSGLKVNASICNGGDILALTRTMDQVLLGSPSWSISGTELTLERKGAGTLVYRWVPADKAATDPAQLERLWRLASVAGDKAAGQVDLYISAQPKLGLSTGGCGAVGGAARVGAGTLRTTGIPDKPLPGCRGDLADQLTTVYSLLSTNPVRWYVQQRKLVIYGGGAQAFSLVFDEAEDSPPGEPSPALTGATTTGKRWSLTGLDVVTAGTSSGTGGNTFGITLALADGTVHVDSHCLSYEGSAVRKADTITFSGVHPTGGRHCADPNVATVVQALAGTAHYAIKGTTLTIVRGGTTLTFEGR